MKKSNFKHIKEDTYRVYEEHAKAYDMQRGKSLFEKKWLDIFINEIVTGKEILDIGCGAADPIGKYFIEKGFLVIGLDASSSMVKICKNKYPNNSWHQLNMIDFNLEKKFDGVIAWNSFFHLDHDEQVKAVEQFSKHLKKNGVLMFTAGHGHGEVLGTVDGQQVYHSSLSSEEYQNLLSNNNLSLKTYKINDPDCNFHSVFLAIKSS